MLAAVALSGCVSPDDETWQDAMQWRIATEGEGPTGPTAGSGNPDDGEVPRSDPAPADPPSLPPSEEPERPAPAPSAPGPAISDHGLRQALLTAPTEIGPLPIDPPPVPYVPPFTTAGPLLCDGVVVEEEHNTFGAGDKNIPDLSWAVLKSGFRVVVAWQTVGFSPGTLDYHLGDGNWRTAALDLETRTHVFVLDDLPVGQTLCFRASDATRTSGLHAVKLVNGPNAYEPATGTYVFNTLSLANEAAPSQLLAPIYHEFATRLWDASNGHVRSGMNLLLHQDLQRHQTGHNTCTVPAAVWTSIAVPICEQVFDVVHVHESDAREPSVAAQDGVNLPASTIWLNAAHGSDQLYADAEKARTEIGPLLMHDVGHYLFDLPDAFRYEDGPRDAPVGEQPPLVESDCFDPESLISVMGNHRGAREFDGLQDRCENRAALGDPIPAWMAIKERFPTVPWRDARPLAGPEGTGDAFSFRLLEALGAQDVQAAADAASNALPAPPMPADPTQPAPLWALIEDDFGEAPHSFAEQRVREMQRLVATAL